VIAGGFGFKKGHLKKGQAWLRRADFNMN